MKQTIKSDRIYTEGGVFEGYITLEDGRITALCHQPPAGETVIDCTRLRVIPGIIDLHNHGFGGWSMTDACTMREIEGYTRAVTSIGVTTVLPTAKEEAFTAIADCMDSEYIGARIHGIHSEGPFWARGGENTVGMTWPTPSLEETERLVTLARGRMTTMAIAPELENAYDVIRYLHTRGIKVACCHTAAYSEDIHRAERDVKFDIVTHLGNGMRGIHHRNVGVLGALLLEDNLYYEVITDLNHICAEMLQIFFKLQPYDKFCLISDSNYIAGLPSGVYMRYDREMFSDEKGLILNSDGRICGSGKWVLFNMGQLERVLKIPFEEIIKMAALNPAKHLGIANQTGSIVVGKDADIAVIDDSFNCRMTFVKGEKSFDADRETAVSLYNSEAMSHRIRDL